MLNPKLILVAVIWGVNFSVLKYAFADFQPLAFTVARFSLAALFLTSIMLITREDFSVSKEDRPAIIRLGFIGITLYNIFFMYGLKHTAASHSALFI